MNKFLFEQILERPNAIAIMKVAFEIFCNPKTEPGKMYKIFDEQYSYGAIKYLAVEHVKAGNSTSSEYNQFRKVNRDKTMRYDRRGPSDMMEHINALVQFCNGELSNDNILKARYYLRMYATAEEEAKYNQALLDYIEPAIKILQNNGWTEQIYNTRVKIYGTYSAVSYPVIMHCINDYMLTKYRMTLGEYFSQHGKPMPVREEIPRLNSASIPCVELDILSQIAYSLDCGVTVDSRTYRAFDVVDFYQLTNSLTNPLVFRRSLALMTDKKDRALVSTYFSKLSFSIVGNTEVLTKQQYTIPDVNGVQVILSEEQKNEALEFIQKNNLPMTSQVYIAVLRRMVNNYPMTAYEDGQYYLAPVSNY